MGDAEGSKISYFVEAETGMLCLPHGQAGLGVLAKRPGPLQLLFVERVLRQGTMIRFRRRGWTRNNDTARGREKMA